MKTFWQTMKGGRQCSHTASNIVYYMPVPDGQRLRRNRTHTPNRRPFPASILTEQFAGGVGQKAKTAIDGTAPRTRRSPASIENNCPVVLSAPQGATKRRVNCVRSHIARCRLDDNSPCPERQVELSLLLWPVEKIGSFYKSESHRTAVRLYEMRQNIL